MSQETGDFWLKFWGVRGSVACPGAQTVRFGGNTSCIEVHCGDYNFILDAGTGLKALGDMLTSSSTQSNFDIFLTHSHMDHICGFPFFKPAYLPSTRLKIWAGHLQPQGKTVEQTIRGMMDQPFFPITVDVLAATLIFNDFTHGESFSISPHITIDTAALNHPGGSTGYRINYGGRSLCYITDTEHHIGALNPQIMKLIEGTDVLIYDSTYTDAEFAHYVGWGHSTWQEGMRLANAAQVKQFVVFHHDPARTDNQLDDIGRELIALRPASTIAREGMVISL